MSLPDNAFWQLCSWLQIEHLLPATSDSITQCLLVHRFAAGSIVVEHHCLVCVIVAVTLQDHEMFLELLWCLLHGVHTYTHIHMHVVYTRTQMYS